jgi:hypothetical protein
MSRFFDKFEDIISPARLRFALIMFTATVLAAVALFTTARSASAHCTLYHPHHCVPEIPPGPSAPVDLRTIRFMVVNNSSTPAFVTRGYRNSGGASTPAGSYTLPVMPRPSWDATGWWRVEPFSTREIYSSSSNDLMYFRVEHNGQVVIPSGITETASFCIHGSSYYSKEYDSGTFTVSYEANGRGGYNYQNAERSSCEDAGGFWRTFYRSRIRHTVTLN